MRDPQSGMKMNKEEIKDLCRRAKNGCDESHKWLYSQAHAILLAWTLRQCYKDLEWFYDFRVKLHSLIGTFDPDRATIGVYVIRCFRSYLSNRIRKVKRRKISNDRFLESNSAIYDSFANPDINDGDFDIKSKALRIAIASLSDDDRYLLIQRHFNGKLLREIGADIGIGVALVSWRLMQIRNKVGKKVTAILPAVTNQPTNSVK